MPTNIERQQLFMQLNAQGWTRDVLPIIPPNATLAAECRIPLEARGKVPGRATPNGYIGLVGWTDMQPILSHLLTWATDSPDCNIGLQCRRVRIIDIDSDDPQIVTSMRLLITRRLGPGLWRGRPNSARGALVYRAEPTIGGKRRLSWQDGKVEVLGLGNQLVIWGEHPSGAHYVWEDRSPFNTKADDLPVLAEAEIPLLLDSLAAALRQAGHATQAPIAIGGGLRRTGHRRPLGDATLVAKDREQVLRALAVIPNTPELADGTPNEHTASYEQVLSIIAAFIGAVGGDRALIDAALVPWLRQWPANDDDWIEARIDSFRDGTEVGADKLFACARSWGFREIPAGSFEKVEEPQAKPSVVSLDDVREKVKGIARGTQRYDPEGGLPVGNMLANAYTDQQLAMNVLQDHGTIFLVCYDHPSDCWYTWRGTHWQRDDLNNSATLHHVRNCLGWITKLLPEGNRGYQLAFRTEGAERAKKILDILRGITELRVKWNASPWLLNTPKGVVDLRTGVWQEAHPTLNLRAVTPVAPDDAPPKVWLQAALEIFNGDQIALDIFIDYLALALLGERQRDAALILSGSGRNGKSMLLKSVAAMLGDVMDGGYALITDTPTAFDERFADKIYQTNLAYMDGARLVAFTETPNRFKPNEALLKAAIANERITARMPYKPAFMYRFSAALLFAANVNMEFSSAIPALRERIKVLTLLQRFKDDRAFYDTVLADAPRLLHLMIGRCVELMQGRESYWLPKSWHKSRRTFETFERKTGEFFDLQDPVGSLVKALVEPSDLGDDHIPVTDLLTKVRWALDRVRENYDGHAAKLDAAIAADARWLAMQIGEAMQDQFGIRSTTKWLNGHNVRVYRPAAWVAHPVLPFSEHGQPGSAL